MDTKTNDIAAVANRLVELCRTGQYDQAQQELYAEDAVSIEGSGQDADSITRGMAAIREKGKQWADNLVEVHGGSVSDPVIADGWFSVAMGLDATYKGHGSRGDEGDRGVPGARRQDHARAVLLQHRQVVTQRPGRSPRGGRHEREVVHAFHEQRLEDLQPRAQVPRRRALPDLLARWREKARIENDEAPLSGASW